MTVLIVVIATIVVVGDSGEMAVTMMGLVAVTVMVVERRWCGGNGGGDRIIFVHINTLHTFINSIKIK